MPDDVNLDRLKSQLMTSGLSKRDNPLFQVISQLIDFVRRFQMNTTSAISSSSGGGGGTIKNLKYITWDDESSALPNSKDLIAGNNIGFDDSNINQRIISGADWEVLTDGEEFDAGMEWSILTNGDPVTPEVIFAGGDVIDIGIPSGHIIPDLISADDDVVMGHTL